MGPTCYGRLHDLKKNFIEHDIPYESQYVDIEYMERFMDFTLSPNFTQLPDFTKNVLHKNDMKLVLIFDPAICRDAFEDKAGI